MSDDAGRGTTATRGRGAAPPPASGVRIPPDTSLRPVDIYTMVYLAFGMVLLLIFPYRAPYAYALAGLHLAGITGILAGRRLGLARWTPGRILLDFYPLVCFVLFYSEVGTLNRLLHPVGFFDTDIMAAEEWMFGMQVSQELHLLWPWKPLGEYFILSYFSYYFLVPGLAFTLYVTGRRAAFAKSIATVSLSFYVSFVFFIIYPVVGPYHVFPHHDPDLLGYFMPRVSQWLVNQGSSLGAAFPSSHVAVSMTAWFMAMRYSRGLAIVYAFLVPTLALGAIYGGFHYAIDAVAGALLAILLATAGHAFTRRLYENSLD